MLFLFGFLIALITSMILAVLYASDDVLLELSFCGILTLLIVGFFGWGVGGLIPGVIFYFTFSSQINDSLRSAVERGVHLVLVAGRRNRVKMVTKRSTMVISQLIKCAYCKSIIGRGSLISVCRKCRTIFHAACWFDERGGACSVYGCNSRSQEELEVAADDKAFDTNSEREERQVPKMVRP